MVFHCRCFSLPFEEDYETRTSFEEDEEIGYETRTQTKSTSSQTFYTASSNLDPSVSELHGRTSVFKNLAKKRNNLRVFTVAELKAATNNFDSAYNIGEGEFGSVYRGVIKRLEHPFDEIQVAVKYDKGVMKGHREWLTEVKFLRVVVHPNLVKLVGFCAEEGMQLFLVYEYEYMRNGSLRDHLSTRSKTPLSWTMRLKVAQDAACGLAYLHEELDAEFLFRDFQSSNIYLDDQWNAKLLDFGVARVVPRTHISTMSPGPVLYNTELKYLSSKSDVWSYGVFLYELITGRRPLDKNLPPGKKNLLEWVGPYTDYENLQRIIDPQLESMCSLKSAQALVNIALVCLQRNPRLRPTMSEVLEKVNALIGALSQATSPMRPAGPPVPVIDVNCKEVVTGEKTNEVTTHEGERGSIDMQLTESGSLPQKPSKSWFRKIYCCVS